MVLIQILVGFALMILGRAFYRLYAAGAGVLVALWVATELLRMPEGRDLYLIALAGAAVGAALATLLRKPALALSSFLLAAYLMLYLPPLLGLEVTWPTIIAAAAAGLIAIAAHFFVPDIVMILLSAAAGTTIIFQMASGPLNNPVLFILLILFGIGVQAVLMQYEPVESSG